MPRHSRWLPQPLILRAAMLAIIAIALFAPLGALVASAVQILPPTVGGFALFNIAVGVTVGLIMIPPIARRALADPLAEQGNHPR